MNTQDAIMRAICAEPDNDEHRWMYASWLLDEGHDTQRGEFIKAQLTVARLRECQKPTEDGTFRNRPMLRVCGACEYCTAFVTARCHAGSIADVLFSGMLNLDLAAIPTQETWNGYNYAMTPPRVTWVYHRGFINTLHIDWHRFAALHSLFIWSPKQTVACPKYHKGNPPLNDVASETDCECSGTGRRPRPFINTAQPIQLISLTTWTVERDSGMERLIPSAYHFVMPGTDYTFSRAKCTACFETGMHVYHIKEDGTPWLSDSLPCGRCNGDLYLRNRWTCTNWPDVEFEMPLPPPDSIN